MQSSQFVGGNYCATKAGLTGLSGAATTMTTAAAVQFAINGKAYSRAAIAGGATPAVDAVTGLPITIGTGKGTNILWCFDAAGNLRLVQGSTEDFDGTGFKTAPPQFASLPDTLTAFAYSVHTNTGAPFTIGVSLWNQAGAAHAVQDVLTVPTRPQTA